MRATDPTLDGSPTSAPNPVSPRRLAANRANAARSTGPRTDAGKARSSANAIRHGLAARAALLPGEDAAELETLAREMEADLRPAGAAEREVVGRVVSLSWRLRRVARAEESLWDAADAEATRGFKVSAGLREQFGYPLWPGESDQPPAPKPAGAFVAAQFALRGTSPLERLAVYEQRIDRALHAALRQLQQLRKARAEHAGDDGAGAAAAASDEAQPIAHPRAADRADAQNEPTVDPHVAEGAAALVTVACNAIAQPDQHTHEQNEPTAPGPNETAAPQPNEPTASASNEPTASAVPELRRGTQHAQNEAIVVAEPPDVMPPCGQAAERGKCAASSPDFVQSVSLAGTKES